MLLHDGCFDRRTIRLLVFGGACAVGAVGAAACLTVSPPALPALNFVRPTILHDAVVPPANVPLVEWPENGSFTVPVEIDVPGESFLYDVFIDYDPTMPGTGNVIPPQSGPDTGDGGIFEVTFQIATPPDPHFCHLIEFIVAHNFNHSSIHTPDSVGGDIVSWWYTAGGGPDGCPAYDAGAAQDDGSPSDADMDGLPVVSGASSP